MYDFFASLPLEAWTTIGVLIVAALVLRAIWVRRRDAIRLEPIDLPPERMPFSAWLRLQTARMHNEWLRRRLRRKRIFRRAGILKKIRHFFGLKKRVKIKTPHSTAVPRQLELLTPAQICKIAARYGIHTSGRTGTNGGRIIVFLLWSAGVLFLAYLMTRYALPMVHIENPVFYWFLTGGLFSAVEGWSVSELFLVSVPKLTGLLTTNYFTKELHTYGVGWSIKYPWEHYTLADYIDLQADIVEKEEGSKFVTAERVPVTFKWSVQFRPFLALLPLYVSTENKAIQQGLQEVVEAVIAYTITDKQIDDIKKPETLKEIRVNLLKALEGREVGRAPVLDEKGSTIEQRFGLQVELDTFSPPTYAPEYSEAMVASTIRKTIQADAKSLKDDLGISGERALDRILALNKDATVSVQSIEINEGTAKAIQNVADSLIRAFTGNRGATPAGGTP